MAEYTINKFTYGGNTYKLKDDVSGYKTTDTDTNTWRNIKVNGTEVLSTSISSGAVNFKQGTGINITNSSGTLEVSSTVVNTDSKLALSQAASGTTLYPIIGSGTTAAERCFDTTGFAYTNSSGTASSIGSSVLTLGNSTASGTAGNKQAVLRMYGSNAKYANITLDAPSADITLKLPTSGGTLALTSQIPTVNYPVTSVNSKTGAVSLTASDVGALPSNTTYVSTITTTAGTHSTISSKSGAVSFNVPTKTSHLTNDSGFITNAGVTGVKGNAESSYRTGQVNLTPANLGAVSKNDELLTTNPFRPASLGGPYISKIDNGFYAADKRWNTSMTNISGASTANLFDGSYETNVTIEAGKTGVLTMDFAPTTYFPGYPYGYILVSFYHTGIPVSVSGRVYCNYESHGIGWHNISFSPISDSGTSSMVYRSEHQGYYNISKLEISIVGASNPTTKVTQVEIHLDRPDSSRTPFLSKYGAETLYYDLTAPNFRGNLIGNVTGTATGNLTSVQYDSTNAKLTYTKNGSNTDIVTVATLKSALGSMPASDVYSWAKASTKPTYTASEVGALPSNHTYTTSIATSSATNQITLAHGTKYAITAGGTSYVFTMPSDNNTDTKVTQAYSTANNYYPLLATATAGASSTSGRGDTTAILNNGLYMNPSEGMLYSSKLSVSSTVSGDSISLGTHIPNNYDGSIDGTGINIANSDHESGIIIHGDHIHGYSEAVLYCYNKTTQFSNEIKVTSGGIELNAPDSNLTIDFNGPTYIGDLKTLGKYDTVGGVKPWFSTTAASTGVTAAQYTNAPAISARTTTAGRYYAIETDVNGRMFVNVPWSAPSGNILYGTSAPGSSTGANGDIYCVYTS